MEMLQDLGREYRLRFEALAPYRQRIWKILVDQYFQKYVPENGVVLDLGSGWGEFIANIKAATKFAMDLNPDAASRAGANTQFLLQDCSATWQIPDDSLDLVFTSNFFEHLPSKDALRSTLKQAIRCLKPGGQIVCMGPNIRFLHDTYWDFWDHFLPLSDRSIVEGLSLAGFRLERSIPRFLPYSMSQGWTPPPSFVAWYLRLPIFWPVFGKQFLVIGSKPSR